MSHAPAHLWQATRDLVARLWRAFVSPAAIAAQVMLSKGEHVLLTRCVQGVEAMLRSLLFVEAVTLNATNAAPAPNPQPARSRASSRQRERSISFRVFASVSRGARRTRAQSNTLEFEIEAYDAWPLAARAEAAMRVLDNPEPYIRRLARKLKPAPRLAQRIPTVGVGHFRVLKDIWHDICRAVADAMRLMPDSS